MTGSPEENAVGRGLVRASALAYNIAEGRYCRFKLSPAAITRAA